MKNEINFPDNHAHNTVGHFDRRGNLFFSEKSRSVIIGNKHGIYGLPHKMLNDLTVKTLEN